MVCDSRVPLSRMVEGWRHEIFLYLNKQVMINLLKLLKKLLSFTALAPFGFVERAPYFDDRGIIRWHELKLPQRESNAD